MASFLRTETRIVYDGNTWALIHGVTMRWTTTWLSSISVLRAQTALQRLMLTPLVMAKLEQAEKAVSGRKRGGCEEGSSSLASARHHPKSANVVWPENISRALASNI